jgi:hypothetical protein
MQAAIGAGAIACNAAMRIRLFPKIEETAARQIVKQLVVRRTSVPCQKGGW